MRALRILPVVAKAPEPKPKKAAVKTYKAKSAKKPAKKTAKR